MTGERKTELDKDALRECPFCGAALMLVGDPAGEALEHPHGDCILGGYQFMVDEAASWNRRALPQSALSSRLVEWQGVLVDCAQFIDAARPSYQQEGCWSEWDQQVRDRITAAIRGMIEAAALGGIPEGWKLVPVEPTEAMLHAGWLQTGESYEMADRTYDRLKRHYEVMLAAAPPLTPGEQK